MLLTLKSFLKVFPFLCCLCCLMATHSSTFVWKIPWMKEPGRLQSLGLQRFGHSWGTSISFQKRGQSVPHFKDVQKCETTVETYLLTVGIWFMDFVSKTVSGDDNFLTMVLRAQGWEVNKSRAGYVIWILEFPRMMANIYIEKEIVKSSVISIIYNMMHA